jgi:hypothetical protein
MGPGVDTRQGGVMRLRCSQSVLVLAVMALYLAPHAFAQATITFAQLNGKVKDTSDRIIAGAAITVRDLATNQTLSTTSKRVRVLRCAQSASRPL